jgi:hypothetical protein
MYAAWDLLLSKGWKKPVLGVVISYGFDIAALFFLIDAGNKLIRSAGHFFPRRAEFVRNHNQKSGGPRRKI